MRLVLLVALCLAPIGCGGGQCARRAGTFSVTSTALGGNCGPIVGQTINITSQAPAIASPCVGTGEVSDDNCAASAVMTCFVGGTVGRISSAISWNPDGRSGTASMTMNVTNTSGALVCAGSYGVVYAKL